MNRKKGITMIILAAVLLVSTVGLMSAESIGGHNITFVNHTYDEGTDISTWYYNVTTGCDPSLSHWIICWCNESTFLNHSEGGDEGYEGKGVMQGIKFDTGYECEDTNAPDTRIVWFKLNGDYPEGLINVSTKAGNNDAVYGAVTGPMDNDYCPGCIVPELPPSLLISAGLLILVGCVAMRRKD